MEECFTAWLKFASCSIFRSDFLESLIKKGTEAEFWERSLIRSFSLGLVHEISKLSKNISHSLLLGNCFKLFGLAEGDQRVIGLALCLDLKNKLEMEKRQEAEIKCRVFSSELFDEMKKIKKNNLEATDEFYFAFKNAVEFGEKNLIMRLFWKSIGLTNGSFFLRY